MIFITERAFEREIEKRMIENEFRQRMDNNIWELRDELNKLKFRMDMMEGRFNEPENCCKTPNYTGYTTTTTTEAN